MTAPNPYPGTVPGAYNPAMGGTPPPPKRRRRWWPWALILGAILFIVVIAVNNPVAPAPAVSTPTPAASAPGVPSGVDPNTWTPGPAVAPAVAPAAAPEPSGPLTTVGPGFYEVGTGDGQVAPGKYKSANPEGYCSVARLKNNDGSATDIIDYKNSPGPIIVTVKKTDGYLQTTGCTLTKA
jgi:hypothetical protein